MTDDGLGLVVDREVGRLLAELDRYRYHEPRGLYASLIPESEPFKGTYITEGNMECTHENIMSLSGEPGKWFCQKCLVKIDETEWNKRRTAPQRPTAPPSPLCVKCGKPATESFYRVLGGNEKAPACHKCGTEACKLPHTGDDYSAGYNWLTGRDAPPVAPRVVCPKCGGSMTENHASDTYRCTACGWTVVSLLVRCNALPGQPTPAPVAKATVPTCWKCGTVVPGVSGDYLHEVAGDHRLLCNACEMARDDWMMVQDRLASQARADLDRHDTHTAWVRKQYQRAVDVPIYGTGGPADAFSPDRRR